MHARRRAPASAPHTNPPAEGTPGDRRAMPTRNADSLNLANTHTHPSHLRGELSPRDARRLLNAHESTTRRMHAQLFGPSRRGAHGRRAPTTPQHTRTHNASDVHARWFGPPSQRRSRSRSYRCSTQTASSRATTAAIHSAHLTVVVTRSCEEAIFLPLDDVAPPRRQLPLQRARLRPQPPLGRAAPDAARRGRCRCVHGIAATALDGDERSVWCAWGIAATAMTAGERGDTAQPRADRAPRERRRND